MASVIEVCAVCRTKAPDDFCACESPEVLLCKDCAFSHTQKPGRDHSIKPIAARPFYKLPGYFERLKVRTEGFGEVQQQVAASVAKAEEASQAYRRQVEQLITTIIMHAEKVQAELERVKASYRRDMDAALEEVQRTLEQDEPRLFCRYAALLRHMAETAHPVPLFSYTLKGCPDPTSLVTIESQLPSQSVPVHVSTKELVHVAHNAIRFFDFQDNC